MTLIREIDFGTPVSPADQMVNLTIDGETVTVPAGTSIMRAAMEMGTEIPKLCATDMLPSFGSCRLCLVEIDGRAGTPASCTTPVAEGMVVHTQTEKLGRLRRGVMELYASDHPDHGLTDPAAALSEIPRMAAAVGLTEQRFAPGANHVAAECLDAHNPLHMAMDGSATPTSSTIRPSASSATAACAPARRCRAPSPSPSRAAASTAASCRAWPRTS